MAPAMPLFRARSKKWVFCHPVMGVSDAKAFITSPSLFWFVHPAQQGATPAMPEYEETNEAASPGKGPQGICFMSSMIQMN